MKIHSAPPNWHVAANLPIAVIWMVGIPFAVCVLLSIPLWWVVVIAPVWSLLTGRITDRWLPQLTGPAIDKLFFAIGGQRKQQGPLMPESEFSIETTDALVRVIQDAAESPPPKSREQVAGDRPGGAFQFHFRGVSVAPGVTAPTFGKNTMTRLARSLLLIPLGAMLFVAGYLAAPILQGDKGQWLTFRNTSQWTEGTRGPVKFSGSFAIELTSEINLKVYRIEDGEDSLEESIRLDPKKSGVVYVTPVIGPDGDSRVVIYAPGLPGKDRSWSVKTGEFMAMGCNPWVGGIDRRPDSGEEVFLFALSISLTPDGTPVAGTVQAMKSESRSHKSTFVAFTCEAIR